MKFMVILKGDKYCEPGAQSESLLAAMARYNRSLIDAGVLLAAEELHPVARSARVEWSNGKRAVAYGPFAEPSGLIAGFWVFNAASLRDAVAWVKRCPLAAKADARFVIRQLHDFGDFDENEMSAIEEERREPLVAA